MKINIITYLIILILGISCNQTNKKVAPKRIDRNEIILDSIYRLEKLDTILSYQPLSLNFKGNPIFSIGQKLTEIDSSLNYRIDPNLDYQDYFPTVKDYMTTEDELSIHKNKKHPYVNGILYFSADRKSERIFNVSGTWNIHIHESGMKEKVKIWLTENLFPTLKNKFEFKENWSYKIETKNQIENFELNKNNENWILNYEVELK